MGVKMTGLEFKAFMAYLSKTNENGWIEDESIYVGESDDDDDPLSCDEKSYEDQIVDTDEITIVEGYWMEPGEEGSNNFVTRLETKARIWLDKHRSGYEVKIMVRVPGDRVDDVKAAIASLGNFSVTVVS